MDQPLTLLFDFRDPYSYLALEPTFALVDDLGIASRCEVLLIPQPKAPRDPAADADRGTWHRWHRGRYQEMDVRRYMESRGLPLQRIDAGGWYTPTAARVAAQGSAWLSAHQPDSQRAYLQAVFSGYWRAELSLDSVEDVSLVMKALGADPQRFAAYLQGPGPAALDAQQKVLGEQGYFNVPAYLVGAEVYYGRQHLPLIRRQLLAA